MATTTDENENECNAIDRLIDQTLALIDDPDGGGLTVSIIARSSRASRPFDAKTGMFVFAGQVLAQSLLLTGDVLGRAHLLRGLVDIVLARVPAGPDWGATIQTLITGFAGTAVDAGLGRQVYENAPQWLCLLENLGNRGHVSDLRLKQVEALLHDGFYEKAQDALLLEPVSALRADLVPTHDRLSQKLDGLLKQPDEALPVFDGESVFRQTLEYLRRNQPAAILTQVMEAHNISELEQGMLGLPAFPPVPNNLQELDKLSRKLASSRAPLATLQSVVQGARTALQRLGNDQGAYLAIAELAARAATGAEALGYWEEMISAAWIEAIALRRGGNLAEARDRLLILAEARDRLLILSAHLDERRRRIAEPRLRAAVAAYLPHLAWVATEIALQVKDAPTALYEMEMAKGRILTDLRQGDAAVATTPSRFMSDLCQRLSAHPNTHFLTFLSDSTADPLGIGNVGVRALLVTNGGDVHAAEVPLSEAVVQATAARLNLLIRTGAPEAGDFTEIFTGDPWRRPFEPLLEILAPLVGWLEPLLAKGVVRANDTLVVSADGSTHNIPLGMLPLAGVPLIETFAVVSMPSLALALSPSTAPRPQAALAALGPMPAERQAGRTFEDEITTLSALLPTKIVTSIEDFRDAVAATEYRLLHFATHGTFSRNAPLRKGGLVMANRSGAYDPYNEAFVLNPNDLAARELHGAHITMRACLVGQVRQITSREALGAVWALLSAGAASIGAASWTVESTSAARWCGYFYSAWLGREPGQGQSRAQAHRAACLALRAEGGHYSHPCYWAPFVLYSGTIEGDVL